MHLSVIKILRLLNSKPKQYLKEIDYSIFVAVYQLRSIFDFNTE